MVWSNSIVKVCRCHGLVKFIRSTWLGQVNNPCCEPEFGSSFFAQIPHISLVAGRNIQHILYLSHKINLLEVQMTLIQIYWGDFFIQFHKVAWKLSVKKYLFFNFFYQISFHKLKRLETYSLGQRLMTLSGKSLYKGMVPPMQLSINWRISSLHWTTLVLFCECIFLRYLLI